jgi:hypothetical protein
MVRKVLAFHIIFMILVLTNAHALLSDQALQPDIDLIKVNGAARVSAEPDRARINMRVFEITLSIIEAKQAVDKKVLRIQTMMIEAGLEAADIGTANFRVYETPEPYPPVHKGDEQDRVKKYTVSRDVIVVVRDLEKLDRVLDAAISLGTNEVQGVDFYSSKEDELRREALMLAAENAKAKAEALASKFGCTVGKATVIQEGGGYNPAPFMAERAMAASGFMQGEIDIEAQVYVEFEIK